VFTKVGNYWTTGKITLPDSAIRVSFPVLSSAPIDYVRYDSNGNEASTVTLAQTDESAFQGYYGWWINYDGNPIEFKFADNIKSQVSFIRCGYLGDNNVAYWEWRI